MQGNHIKYNNLANQFNFVELIPAVMNLLETWKQRNLTVAGKIRVFKILAFSKLFVISAENSVPNMVINKLHSVHIDFIWNGERLKNQEEYKNGDFPDVGQSSNFDM